jgi:glycosyltransferase involved in cell wall biosynthesis
VRLSVIIPTLNEARYLGDTVERVRAAAVLGGPHEVIISDCGSTDDTRERALALGALLVSDEPCFHPERGGFPGLGGRASFPRCGHAPSHGL